MYLFHVTYQNPIIPEDIKIRGVKIPNFGQEYNETFKSAAYNAITICPVGYVPIKIELSEFPISQ